MCYSYCVFHFAEFEQRVINYGVSFTNSLNHSFNTYGEVSKGRAQILSGVIFTLPFEHIGAPGCLVTNLVNNLVIH